MIDVVIDNDAPFMEEFGLRYMYCEAKLLVNTIVGITATNDRLVTYKPKTRKELYAILHELGHIQDKDMMNYHKNIFSHELTAWGYAYQCTKKEYHDEITQFAIQCLKTYEPDMNEDDIKKSLIIIKGKSIFLKEQ